MRASSLWILKVYRRFCGLIYGRGVVVYDLVSFCVSLGAWDRWRSLALLDLSAQDVCLELGFGTGGLQKKFMEACKANEPPCFGLEYSPHMIRHASKPYVKNGVQRPWVRGDGCHLPFKSNAFDRVMATFPEQYITSEECLSDVYHVLKEGGVFILVGRYVELRSRFLTKIFPVFFRPLDLQEFNGFRLRAESFGFKFSTIEKCVGIARHTIVKMEKT